MNYLFSVITHSSDIMQLSTCFPSRLDCSGVPRQFVYRSQRLRFFAQMNFKCVYL